MRHDGADLRDETGNRVVPRTLLQTLTIEGAGDAVLILPESPWTRFEVQIDDWAPSQNQVAPILQLGLGGSIKAGVDDYQLQVNTFASNTNITADFDDANSSIRMTRDDNSNQAGNELGESFTYRVTIAPGSSDADLPKVWFDGAGVNDAGRLLGVLGFGVYRGTTSGVYGRADQIRFSFDENTIARGIFRLYGTE